MSEYNSKMSTCNYVPLKNYYGGQLGDGAVAPVPTPANLMGVQIVPQFAGVSYDQPNYDSLVKVQGGCNNYPNVNQAYLSKNCVKYMERQCNNGNKPQPLGQVGFQCMAGALGPNPAGGNCIRVNQAPNQAAGIYDSAQACNAACGNNMPGPVVGPTNEGFRYMPRFNRNF
jgi:hypothetical protein